MCRSLPCSEEDNVRWLHGYGCNRWVDALTHRLSPQNKQKVEHQEALVAFCLCSFQRIQTWSIVRLLKYFIVLKKRLCFAFMTRNVSLQDIDYMVCKPNNVYILNVPSKEHWSGRPQYIISFLFQKWHGWLERDAVDGQMDQRLFFLSASGAGHPPLTRNTRGYITHLRPITRWQ